ncbi:hypothetical protein, partial [Lactococcus lactis]
SDDSFYFWGVAPIPKQAKKDSFLSLLFLFFSQVAQAQKSSAGNFIESISCGGSAVLVSMTSSSERASVARLSV